MYITDSAAQLVHKPVVSSGKIEFLLSRISSVRRHLFMLNADLIIRFANRTVAENGQGVDPRRADSVVGSRLAKVSPNGPATKSSRRAATKGHRVSDVDCA
jgi:protein subunit release factor B